MHQLRSEIHLQAYGQRDPLVQYRIESADMFEDMISQIQADVVRAIYHVRVSAPPRREQVAQDSTGYRPAIRAVGGGSAPDEEGLAESGSALQGDQQRSPLARQKPVTVEKIGRNDPCPCGSGKKYKKCCGA